MNPPPGLDVLGWSIQDHLAARRAGITAESVINAVLHALETIDDRAILIGEPLRESALVSARTVDAIDLAELPLHGVPFLVKDNIDVAGAPTTCAFPPYLRVAETDAAVVARLRGAGAIPIGKTNLDQFATGLVGTRSPYGVPTNPLNASLVPGGSSSGSAVSVARGLVPFSLGTDTAGSGRVPAAMCGIVGLKPTLGRLPSIGMVPAVRRIDCPSIFARSVADARLVAGLAAGPLEGDAYSRKPSEATRAIRSVGVLGPEGGARSLMSAAAQHAYDMVVQRAQSIGFNIVDIELDAFLEAGRLLYGGPFVAERTAAVGEYFAGGSDQTSDNRSGADPTVHSIVSGGASRSAIDAYRGEYQLAELRTATLGTWSRVDALLLPTTPGVATLAQVAAEPITKNAWLGTFTTFTNLLDLAAISVPVGARPDGMPSAVQLIGPAWSDEALADVVALLLAEPPAEAALRQGEIPLVVVGAHLTGMTLNAQLTGRGARLVRATKTAPTYRLFALAGTVPPKPGLQRVDVGGVSIAVEVWALGPAAFASFVAAIPAPLGIGSVQLDDATWCSGFICEPWGFDGAADITHFGGWRAYVQSSQQGGPAS